MFGVKTEPEPVDQIPKEEEEIEIPIQAVIKIEIPIQAVIKIEPEGFVFTNYLDNSPGVKVKKGGRKNQRENVEVMPFSDDEGTLRKLIIRGLEFYASKPRLSRTVPYETINRYVQKSLKRKTDCASTLNKMVLDEIVARSGKGKGTKNGLYRINIGEIEQPKNFNCRNSYNSDNEERDFNRLIMEVLETAELEDSPVTLNTIINYLKNGRSKWSFKLRSSVNTFLKNASSFKNRDRCVVRILSMDGWKYRMISPQPIQQPQAKKVQAKKKEVVVRIPSRGGLRPRVEILKNLYAPHKHRKKKIDPGIVISKESSTQMSQGQLIVKSEKLEVKIENVEVKIENETDTSGIDIKYE